MEVISILPTIEEAERELQIAGKLNPGPRVKHSLNVGIVARNNAQKIPSMDIQLCDSLATDYGFVIIEKRFVDVTRRYGIMEGYVKDWNKTFEIKENFEKVMGCSVYDVLPDIGRTTLLSPPPWKPPVK